MSEADLLLSVGQLVTMAELPGEPGLIEDGAVACLDGRVLMTGPRREVEASFQLTGNGCRLDLPQCVATPGLIDCHSHVVFSGWRAEEFRLRLQGAGYMEVLKSGGGILNTVRATREAPGEHLLGLGKERLDAMLGMGTTTVEAKSGYGLNTQTEVKCLRVLKALNETHPIDVLPTFLGAHAVPPEFHEDANGYVNLVCEEMIPRVAEQKIARYIDVFCEEGAFSVAQSRRVLETGMKYGLLPRLHADEFRPSGGAELAATLGALSADHLGAATDKGLRAMSARNVVAVLLPGTSFFCRESPARMGRFREAGLRPALGTDFNPGSCTIFSLPLIMSLACITVGMSPWEALEGCTIQAAKALGIQEETGSLEPGKIADITVFNAPGFEHIAYRVGHDLIRAVIKRGRVAILNT